MRLLYLLVIFFIQINLYAKQDTVSLQLNWLHQFQFAGFYVAKEKGFYKEKGLYVNLLEFDKSDVIKKITQREVDFGVGKSSLIVKNNTNPNIAMIMPIFQSSPSVLITTNPSIQKIKDFRNKKIMITNDEMSAISINSMLVTAGLTHGDYQVVPHAFNTQDLIDKKVDAMACYTSNEPYIFTKKNVYFKVFNPCKYGLNFYGDILFTSKEFIKENPSLVKNFYYASKEGWLYALSHIEETAQLIYEKYNSQNKSLEHLIFEGRELKKLAFDNENKFGTFNSQKIDKIVEIYKLFNLIPQNYKLDNLVDPLGIAKTHVHIGVLANRGKEISSKQWSQIAEFLTKTIPGYFFHIITLSFKDIDKAIADEKIDFILTNTMNYMQLKHKYQISSIATLENLNYKNKKPVKYFGSVIFTRAERDDINSIKDIKGKKFAAVNENSFGGWVMAKKEMKNHNIVLDKNAVIFSQNQDAVVYDVLNKKVDVGSVRTNILELMELEKKIDIKDFKIISEKKYEDFPYLVSTDLYPEWPFAKLKHTSEVLSLEVLKTLISISNKSIEAEEATIYGWTIPLQYTKVDNLLKELELPPYDNVDVNLKHIFNKYQSVIFVIICILIILLAVLIHVSIKNRFLKEFGKKLEIKVRKRTKELHQFNRKLKLLANTDELTGIDNRRNFYKKMTQYIKISKRNNTPLFYLSLDLDFFKKVNDTYGHLTGDEVLKHFTNTINENLRESDLFGRVGGEEFGLCLQNTTLKGSKIIAEKIRTMVEKNPFVDKHNKEILITVSIGLAQYKKEYEINDLIKVADCALYEAKENGRNQIVIYT